MMSNMCCDCCCCGDDVCLDKKEEKNTVLSKLGLDDWKFALPIGLLVGIPAVANEVSNCHYVH